MKKKINNYIKKMNERKEFGSQFIKEYEFIFHNMNEEKNIINAFIWQMRRNTFILLIAPLIMSYLIIIIFYLIIGISYMNMPLFLITEIFYPFFNVHIILLFFFKYY